jgi:predicted sulfurtransferase
VSIGVNFWFSGAQKNFEKSQKKACQPTARSLNGGVDATNRSRRPFKKTLKKVKKKLVSAEEI